MEERMVTLTWKRVKEYIKKYWWILCLCVVIGAGLMAYGIINNKKQIDSQKNLKAYTETMLVSFDGNSSYISTSAVIGDCVVLMRTKDFSDSVNQKLQDREIDTIDCAADISLTREESSNCFSISLTEVDDDAEETLDIVVDTLEKEIEGYHATSVITAIDKKAGPIILQETSVLQLKHFLIFFGFIFLGAGIIYLIIILDKKIIAVEEVTTVLGRNPILNIDKQKDMDALKDWFKIRSESGEHSLALRGRVSELVETTINQLQSEKTKICEASKIGDLEKDYDIILLVEAHMTKKDELSMIKRELDFYQRNLTDFIFIE